MFASTKKSIFPLISTIILPKVFTLLNPMKPDTLVVLYRNMYVALKVTQKKNCRISVIKSYVVVLVDKHVNILTW